MKKTAKITITAIALAFIALGVYFIPQFSEKQEVQRASKIKTDTMAFTQRALEEFQNNKDIKASEVAQMILDEFNKTGENPYNKNLKPYTFEKECKGASSVEFDNNLQMIILTTYDKKGTLVARTVIKPPSFVTYSAKDK